MKYLRKYESYYGTSDYDKKVKASNDAHNNRIEKTKEILKATPNYMDVCNSIKDVFQEHVDQGVELEVEMSVPDLDGRTTLTVYYPFAEPSERSGKTSYFPTYGDTGTDKRIYKILNNKREIYYDITFGIDSDVVKDKTRNRFLRDVDTESEEFLEIYGLLKDVASDTLDRLSSMYNVKVELSTCLMIKEDMTEVEPGVYSGWKKCDPRIDTPTTKVNWLLSIK